MDKYNEFYLHIEEEIEKINTTIFYVKSERGSEKTVDKLIEDKEVVINKAFKELNIPQNIQEEFRDELFSDEEFDHLMLRAS